MIRSRRSICAFVPVLLVSLTIIAAAPASAQTQSVLAAKIDSTERTPIRQSVHRLARPETRVGPLADEVALERMILVLGSSLENETALSTFLDAQQDKDSPKFHKWLSPKEFADQFGPSEEDVTTVERWLQQEGFTVTGRAQSRRWIEFRGTAAHVQRSFQTPLARYAMNGEEHIANATEISVPTALAPVVRGVLSLNDFSRQPYTGKYYEVSRNSDGRLAPVDPNFTLQGTIHYLAPGDLAKIYNVTPLYSVGLSGAGQTIAIAGRSHFQMGDVYMFRKIFSLPDNDPVVVVNGPDALHGVTGDSLESSLDVQWAGALAPQATIKFVVSSSTVTTDGIDLSAAYIVDKNLADIVSLSYGACEQDLGAAGNAFYNDLWRQAAAQGMTVFVSSGDNGAAGCDSASASTSVRGAGVNGLASSPYDTAVGGTQFSENGNDAVFWSGTNGSDLSSAIGYIPEMVWNESCAAPTPPSSCSGLWAGSGGASTLYSKPAWQSGNGVPSDGRRDLPDVSLTAASGHDGYLICFVGSCAADNMGLPGVVLRRAGVIGGTSASAPAMAGIFALVNEKMGGGRQGAANWMLYRISNASSANVCDSSTLTNPLSPATCSFYDITGGHNNVPGRTGATAAAGYDLATGLGSVNAANLAQAWSGISLRSSMVTFSLGSTSMQHGAPTQVTVSVSPASGTGVPSGSVVLISDKEEAFATLPLTNGSFNGPVSTLPGGQFNVTAHYGGDEIFGASDSSKVAVDVSNEPSTTFLGAYTYTSNGPVPVVSVPYGDFIYFHVKVAGTSGAHASGGTVAFYEGATQLGTVELTSQGEGEFVSGGFTILGAVVCLPVGAHTITAQFEGGPGLDPSASSPLTVQVNKASPFTYFANLTPVTLPENSPMPTIVSVSQTGPILPTGTLQFFVNGTSTGPAISIDPLLTGGRPEGRTTLTLPAGSYSISAAYSGDSVYLPSDTSSFGGSLSVTMQPKSGTPTVTTLSIPSTASSGSVPYTVTVTTTSGTPTGTVTLSGPNLGTLNPITLVGGVATSEAFMNGPAKYVVTATYSGDSTHAASASSPSATDIPKTTPSITLSATKNSIRVGERVNLVTNVIEQSSSSVPGELVQYYDSVDGAAAQPLGQPRILTTGPIANALSMIDSYSVALTKGVHTLTVQYLDNFAHNSVTSAPVTVNVDVTPDITLTQMSALPTITAGQSGSTTLSITPVGGIQGDATLSCSGAPVGASCTFNPPSITLNGAAVNATMTVTTTAPSSVSTALDVPREHQSISWWVLGLWIVGICAVFGRGRSSRGTACVVMIACALSFISCGGSGGSSPPSGGGGGPNPVASSTSLTVSAWKAPQGTMLTLTASVTTSGIATGNVTFFSGTDPIGSPIAVSNGSAQIQTNALALGTHTITARYAGDSGHLGSTSGALRTAVTGSTQLQVRVKVGAVQKTTAISLTLQ